MARTLLRAATVIGLACLIWIPALQLFFGQGADPEGRARVRERLLADQLGAWEDPEERVVRLERMRGANAEWDFMGRTFLVLALANRGLERPRERARVLPVIDAILEQTLALEAEHGQTHFLMSYVHRAPFEDASGRSVFVDGEIALMLAARQRVERADRWEAPLRERVDVVATQMRRGPVLSAESYPDECWTFCNTVALAALRVSDSSTGDDHSALLHEWVAMARARLVDRDTGLLVSSYRHDGTHLDGPEGSSVFLAAHMLTLVDPVFAREQYRLAREHLGVSFVGFGWSREWPASWEGPADIDSGPIVPVVDASAGASGMALLGAAAFDDDAWLEALHTSLAFAAFPVQDDDGFRYAASNQVGDAVLLYSLSQGPLFDAVGPAPSAGLARTALARRWNGGPR